MRFEYTGRRCSFSQHPQHVKDHFKSWDHIFNYLLPQILPLLTLKKNQQKQVDCPLARPHLNRPRHQRGYVSSLDRAIAKIEQALKLKTKKSIETARGTSVVAPTPDAVEASRVRGSLTRRYSIKPMTASGFAFS